MAFPLVGYTELALDKLPQDSLARVNLEQVLQSSLRARDLIAQLLAFGRKQVLEFKAFDINDLIIRNQFRLQRIIGEEIGLDMALDEDACIVRADFNQIEQALFNLITNARYAMPEGGRVIIETKRVSLDDKYPAHHPGVQAGDYVMLRVTDNGHGIRQDIIEKIFDPLDRAKNLKSPGLFISGLDFFL